MALPHGWNDRLSALEKEISTATSEADRLTKEMNEEIEAIRKKYVARMPNISALRKREEQEWERIRKENPIQHPKRREFHGEFGAALVLATYWQGPEMPQTELIRKIYSDSTMYAEAASYATNLTSPGSPERELVQKAQQYLWRDYTR